MGKWEWGSRKESKGGKVQSVDRCRYSEDGEQMKEGERLGRWEGEIKPGRRTEVRGRRTEVGGRRAEDGGQRAEDGRQKLEAPDALFDRIGIQVNISIDKMIFNFGSFAICWRINSLLQRYIYVIFPNSPAGVCPMIRFTVSDIYGSL